MAQSSSRSARAPDPARARGPAEHPVAGLVETGTDPGDVEVDELSVPDGDTPFDHDVADLPRPGLEDDVVRRRPAGEPTESLLLSDENVCI